MHFTPLLLRKKNCFFLNLCPPLCHIVVLSTSLSSRSTSLFIGWPFFPIQPFSISHLSSFTSYFSLVCSLPLFFSLLFHSLPFDLSFSICIYISRHICMCMCIFFHINMHAHIYMCTMSTPTHTYIVYVYTYPSSKTFVTL